MIVRGQSRTGWKSLADHLMKTEKNERVEVLQVRGTISEDLHESLEEMEALAVGTRCKRVLYHASFSPAPGEALTAEQLERCGAVLAAEFEMEQHARAIVLHTKGGEQHAHVVVCRIDPETMKAAHDGHNFARNEAVARQLEREFGLQRVQGVFAERETDSPRAERTPELWEMQQRHKTEIDPRQFRKEMRELLAEGDGASFVAALPECGVTLCRGDRRDFVLVDAGGGMHSLSRAVGLKAAEVRELLEAVDREALPSVAEARQALEQTRQLERPVEVREQLERLVAEPEAGRVEALAPGRLPSEALTPEREVAAGAVEPEAEPLEVESLPSVGEIGRSVERSADKVEHVAAKGLGVALDAVEVLALGAEAFLFGGSRKAPGGAEYTPPGAAAAAAPAPAKAEVQKSVEALRTTSGEEAIEDPQVLATMASDQIHAREEALAAIRRRLEKEAEERKARNQGDGGHDRER
jgi:hypothetical protein